MAEKKKVVKKRARTAKGRFKADDPRTPFINEHTKKFILLKITL